MKRNNLIYNYNFEHGIMWLYSRDIRYIRRRRLSFNNKGGVKLPKATFFNLPKEKIEKIVEVAIDEFTKYSYDTASINRIVEGADIAKGSFYQYFKDKLDIYSYIVEESESKRKSYILEPIQGQAFISFFKSLKDVLLADMKFAIELPKLAAISLDFRKSRSIEVKKEVLKNISDTTNVFEELVKKGIDNMDIDDAIDFKSYTYLLESLNTSVLEYYIYEVNLDYEKTLVYIDNIIILLKEGIKLKRKMRRNVEDRFY